MAQERHFSPTQKIIKHIVHLRRQKLLEHQRGAFSKTTREHFINKIKIHAFHKKKGTFLKLSLGALGHGENQSFKLLEQPKEMVKNHYLGV